MAKIESSSQSTPYGGIPSEAARIEAISDWFTVHAKALETGDSARPLQAHEASHLDAIIGNARIVGLGETTHGRHEVFEMKPTQPQTSTRILANWYVRKKS